MSGLTALDVLERARERISDPAKWFKGAFADQYANNFPAIPMEELYANCKVCAYGALCWAASGQPDTPNTLTDEAYSLLVRVIPGANWGVADYNDRPSTTHEDILALFDRAIEKAKAEALVPA